MRVIGRAFAFLGALAMLAGASLSGQGGLVANAGPDQSGMFVGTTVNLNGGASVGATSYAWTFLTRPSGSAATLTAAATVTPSFVPDKVGAYTVRLTVGDGSTTATDTVVITTGNRPPVANAGADQSADVGDKVILNGTASTDPDLDKLTYQWTLVSRPPASAASLAKATTSKPSLLLDRAGAYVVRLIVRDGSLFSPPDDVTITTTNSLPVANAGPDRQVDAGTLVQVSGAGSSDVDGDALTFTWTLKKPKGSSASLSGNTTITPSFLADIAGSYTATLTVGDGTTTKKDTVVVTTTANLAPVARTGRDEVALEAGQQIQLDGIDTTDANGQLLAYAWTITKKPGASTASLVGAATPRPTFTADVKGKYTFSLAVTDPGALAGSDTTVYSATLPQADAGPDQLATLGSTVTLDGSRSTHVKGTLAYGWALLAAPAGSTAALNDPTDPQPSFVPDVEGVYLAQLIVFDGTGLSPVDTVLISTGANLAPRVDLGPDRLVSVATVETIDALATDPNLDALTFTWALLSRPAGSSAALTSTTGTPVQITPDVAGDYVVQMKARDPGGQSATGTLLLTTGNTAPVAEAGADRSVPAGVAVDLELTASDPDGDALTYAWAILKKPAGSNATISAPTEQEPSFTPTVDGVYVVQAAVRDSRRLLAVDTTVFRVGAGGEPPLADAGPDQTVLPGALVTLNGTGSSNPESEPLTYSWTFVSKPAGSTAAFSDPTNSQPTFTADLPGAYVIELVVNDGTQDSAPDEVVISANGPPTANAGPDQTVEPLSLVSLNGTASFDPESQPLTYAWSFVSKPGGSGAALAGAATATPTFTADVIGVYVLQLVVNDGVSDSAADTVTVSTRRSLSLAPSSVSLSPGGSAVLTVSLQYATSTAVVVTLSSTNTGAATVPPSVTILASQTSATFNVTAGPTSGGTLVKATASGLGTAETAVAMGTRLVQWDVDTSGAWETATNWTDDAVPGPGDVVVIDRPAGSFVVTIGSPTAAITSLLSRESLNVFSTLTVDGHAAFDGAVSLNATLTGAGAATVNAPFTWTTGTISLAGGLENLVGQTLTFPTNGASRLLLSSSLTNHGTVAMGASNALVLQTAATVTNAADGLWTVTDAGVFATNGAGAYVVTNAGTLRKTGVGVLTFAGSGVPYANTGTIDLQGGTVAMGESGTLTNSGQLALAAGTTFFANAVTLAAGTTFAGSGTLSMNGTTTVTADLTVTVPAALTATLTGAGPVRMAAPFTWTTGTISLAGGLENLAGQTLTFPTNGASRLLLSSSLTNHGTVAMGASNALVLQTAATVTNAADGLWTVTDAGVFATNGAGAYVVTNAGTLRKTGVGVLTFAGSGVPYANTGTIDLQGGTVAMGESGTLTNSGQLALAAGTTFFANAVTLAAGTTFAGSGTLSMNGTTTVTADLTVTVPAALTATLTGAGPVRMAAPFTWTTGTISLAGGLENLAGQTLTFPTNGASRLLLSSSLTNHGTVAMGASNALVLQTAATVTNAADGLWTVTDAGVFATNGAGAYVVTNAGTLRKTGVGVLTFAGSGVPYANTGTIDLQGGTVAMGESGTLTNSGQLALAAGTTFFANAVTLAAGTTFAGSGTLSMNGTTTVTADLTVTVPAALTATLTGAGPVRMAAPFTWTTGTISLAGGLENLAGQTLTFPTNGASRLLLSSSLTNHGTVAMGASNALVLQTAATVTNAADGLWTVTDAGVFATNGAGAYVVTNAGTLRKTGVGVLTFAGSGVPYANTGTIDLQGGTVAMGESGTLTNSGQLALAAGTTFFANAVTLAAGTTFAGSGTLSMNGTTTVTADLTVTLPTSLHATLTGAGTVRMAAPLTWTTGVVSLAGGLENLVAQTLTFPNNGASRLLLTGSSLRNFGTVSWEAGSGALVYQGGEIAVRNEAGGLWTYGAGGYSITQNGDPSPPGSFTFLNNGTMQGAGNPTTTVTVGNRISFSGTGAVNNMLLSFQP